MRRRMRVRMKRVAGVGGCWAACALVHTDGEVVGGWWDGDGVGGVRGGVGCCGVSDCAQIV